MAVRVYRIKTVARKFDALYRDVVRDWTLHKYLFGTPRSGDPLKHTHFDQLFAHFNGLLIDRWFLSVARLHDPAQSLNWNPAKSKGWENFSLEYITEHKGVDAATRQQLRKLIKTMGPMARRVKRARDKLLAHNDPYMVIRGIVLGRFAAKEGERYMNLLAAFAKIVVTRYGNGPFIHDDIITNDADALLETLSRGLVSPRRR